MSNPNRPWLPYEWEAKVKALEEENAALSRELASTLGRAKNAESIMVANGELRDNFLLHLVDVVWGNAMEDDQVPSTEHARKLIRLAKETYVEDGR